jgi:pimeloyl-ACP methyl ester carboxylesterase
VLAHQGNGDLCTWWPFARRLAASGFRAVAFDFRGYGLSPDRGYPAALRKDLDLRAAIAEARALGARRILLAGASLGGTVALAAAARPGTTVEGVVSLSAPETYVRLDGKALARRSKVPILLVAARDDAAGQFATDARTLHAASAAADKRLVIVAGGEHGVPLLERPALWKLVLGWLRSH